VEVEGDIVAQNGKEMLEELRGCCDKLKVAGSFELMTL
jgi:prephenate dehydratase